MPDIGPVELIIILVVVCMLFGVGKLPEVFGAVGRGVREFRQAMSPENESPAPAATEPSAALPAPQPAADENIGAVAVGSEPASVQSSTELSVH